MEADVAGIFDQQALPRLDQQAREQGENLLDAAGDQHCSASQRTARERRSQAAMAARASYGPSRASQCPAWKACSRASARRPAPRSAGSGQPTTLRQRAQGKASAAPALGRKSYGAGGGLPAPLREMAAMRRAHALRVIGPSTALRMPSRHDLSASVADGPSRRGALVAGRRPQPQLRFDGRPGLAKDGSDVGAGADAPVDVALGAQPFVGRGDGEARDAKLFGEVARGWQPVAGAQPAAQDGGAQLGVDLPRQPVGSIAPPVEWQQEVNGALVHDWPCDLV